MGLESKLGRLYVLVKGNKWSRKDDFVCEVVKFIRSVVENDFKKEIINFMREDL